MKINTPKQKSFRYGMVVIWLFFLLLISSSCSIERASADKANTRLVEALKSVPVKGPSFGAPVAGLSANSATDAVVQKGPAIIPTLIAALDHSSWTQTVWIVFCLRQLRATEAKDRIVKLQQEVKNGRFRYQAHDLTLDVGIQSYLMVIATVKEPDKAAGQQ